ncbi:LysE family translocator [Lichenifustis flavocetrariae]|uniref:LysE family translocator n=1 Tax=Lichenifustis flavocetrariae TaxID=2949735 RepID=A0AA41YX32_9HYPH|nr:LysE family translocator [Lichenifustis flavocetrariae]MCW6510184.1 LysE family translocator [Lichenifustis flavocetrariae]
MPMSIVPALVAFILAAGLLTVTPGLDTVLVLRMWLTDGRRAAWRAAFGIQMGCLAWGSAVAVGLAAVLETAPVAYEVLRWFGAAYLLWCGLLMLARPRERLDAAAMAAPAAGASAFRRGFLTNLLNPKVGLFYLSFLPQFVPPGLPAAPFMILLTTIHIALALAWFALLLGGAAALRQVVTQRAGVVRWLDRLTGIVFVGFGLRLAFEGR